MRPARANIRFLRWGVVWLLGPVLFSSTAFGSSSDFLVDDAQRDPVPLRLGPTAERQAEAMARFVTGIFEEETLGPERAMESFHRVLEIDPSFSRLAIDVAHDHLRRGQATEAIGVLKDALKATPKESEIALALSSIYLRHLRKPDLATRYAEQAISIAPTQIGGYEALWEIALTEGNSANIQKALDRAMRAKSDASDYWLKLAEMFSTSTSGDAFSDPTLGKRLNTCLERAVEHAQGDPVALAKIADFYAVNRMFEQAADLYAQSYEEKPSLPNLREKYTEMLVQLGRFDMALPLVDEVIAENPLAVRAYDQLAVIYTQQENFAKAAAALEQAIIIDKSIPFRHNQLARVLLIAGETDKAIDRLAEARQIFPHAPNFTHLHAMALSQARRHAEAFTMFERAQMEAALSQPVMLDGAFYFEFGMAAEAAGRYVKAAELFKKSIELDPMNSALALNALGYMWADRNENLDEAEALIRRALELDPENGAIIDSLGWVLYRKGDFESALHELLRAATALGAPDPVVFDHIGDAYHALNRDSEAVLYWQKALQIDDANSEILEKVDRISSRMVRSPAE